MTVISVNIGDEQGEIIVRSGFYELAEAPAMWDRAVRRAQTEGWWLPEALNPSGDPRHSMHVDLDGTEHHYLVPAWVLTDDAHA